MQKPINEIERLKLIAGLINEVEYTDAVYGVNRKTVLTEAKKKEVKKKEVTIDTVNPYEYRHGLQYELTELDDYSDEALEKAKATVLKNLAKDVNFYSTLLNAKQSPFTFKQTETDAPGMQANADGTLKKGAGKLDKANVQDSLGKKEAGKKKPKGVKVMPDKGVEGKEKVVKEGKEEMNENFKYFDNYEEFENTLFQLYPQVKADPEKYKKDGIDGEVRYSDGYVNWGSWYPNRPQSYSGLPPGAVNMNNKMSQSDLIYPAGSRMDEDNMESSPVNGDSSAEGQFNQLMSKYDWYYEMSDDPRKYDTGTALDQKLKSLATTIGIDRAVELFNLKAPSDRKVTSTFFMEGKVDKHAKIKEALKSALKKKVTEDDTADENAKKSAIQTEKAKLIALNKQKSELSADKTKTKEVKDTEMKGIDLKIRSANDQLTKLNQGKIDVV
jgi:hypothetical protein